MENYYDLDQVFLTGPISCFHIKWKTKEFLLFGDLHCPRIKAKIDLINFLELVANKTNENKICVDFFHELPFEKQSTPIIEHDNYDGSDILIDQIRIIFGMDSKYNGDKYPYFRIHGWELSQYTKFNSSNLLLWRVYDKGVIDDYELIYNFYCDNKDNQYDKEFRDIIEQKQFFVKHKITFDNEKFLSLLIHKQISNIDTNYFEPRLLFDFFKKTSNLRLAVLETYSIARMFRKFDYKEKRSNKCNSNDVSNIIYFGGNAHVLNVFNFLKFLSEIDTEAKKDIQFLYNFETRKATTAATKSCSYQQSIVIKSYNFFNLFPNKNDLKKMLVGRQLEISNRVASPVHLIRYMNPEAPEFIPQVHKQTQNLDKLKNKYLKYKLKYINLKKSLD